MYAQIKTQRKLRKEKTMVIFVTGHRPAKLFGYNLNNPGWIALKEKIEQILVEQQCTKGISGMALGTDTIFALAVLELRAAGYPIKLQCAIPCKNHSSKWHLQDIQLYQAILNQADEIILVSDTEYNKSVLQKRNIYMVDHSDKGIAVWNGSSGGTKNCINYAEKQGKEMIYIDPMYI